ncbi:MAG: RuvX/YqgF family protein [Parcubacteria group bacterium]|jgi:putative Holliday junction resolvase
MNCQAQKPNIPQISHILGIDYGKSKVGLALADSETRIAFVYTTLPNDKNFLDNLVKIIEKESVGKIIIGIPTYVNSENIEIEKLKTDILRVLPEISIEYHNEMFSTKIAQANLVEKGMKNVGKFDDSESAKIILQSWLDKE